METAPTARRIQVQINRIGLFQPAEYHHGNQYKDAFNFKLGGELKFKTIMARARI
jgi:hypothetical protein